LKRRRADRPFTWFDLISR